MAVDIDDKKLDGKGLGDLWGIIKQYVAQHGSGVVPATEDTLGGIMVGSTLSITSAGVLNLPTLVTASTFRSVSVDAYGRVVGGTNPTTLAGYGITDAKIENGVITLGGSTITPITSLSGYATQSWVQQQGYTTNIGTVTQVKIGSTAYNPSSGVVSLPAYPTSLPASDVYSWAKASSKPSYSWSEIGSRPTALSQFTNDSGYITSSGSCNYASSSGTSSYVSINYNNDSNSTYQMLWGSGNGVYGTGGIYCNPYTDYMYSGSFYCGNWFRSTGNTGWYNESYGGGWYMTDSSWVRAYNGKGVVASGFYHNSYGSSSYALTSDGGAVYIGNMSVSYASSAGSCSYATYMTYFKNASSASVSESNWDLGYGETRVWGQSWYRNGDSGDMVLFLLGSTTVNMCLDGAFYANEGFKNRSDMRCKDVVSYYDDLTVEKVAYAPVFRFTWKDEPNKKYDKDIHIGTSAQYWQPVFPELIGTDMTKTLCMPYDTIGLISAIVTAKETVSLKRQVEYLTKQVEYLEDKIGNLENDTQSQVDE